MNTEQNGNWERVVGTVEQMMIRMDVPGVAVGILQTGEITAAGFGLTNVDHPLEVTGDTVFQIGSITKTFTGTTVMRLVESGKLDLDATVRTYLPDFKVADEAASSQVTVRHLLCHMAGWVGDYFVDTGPGADAFPRYVAKMAELEQLAPFGAVWSYTNSGFYLLGFLIETVTGQRYEDAVMELACAPLGLTRLFYDAGAVMVHRFVAGHDQTDDGPQVAQPWPLERSAAASGGITTSVHEVLRWASFHMGDGKTKTGERLLNPESLSLMQTPQAHIWKDEAWGLAWRLQDIEGVRLVGHAGGTRGQVSLLTLVPEKQFAVAVLTNSAAGGPVTRHVTKQVLDDYLGVKQPVLKPLQASSKELAAYAGRYSRSLMDIELGMLSGRLIAQAVYKRGFLPDESPPPPSPPFALGLCETDRLLVLDGLLKGTTADIIRRDDGSIGWLRFSNRIHRRID